MGWRGTLPAEYASKPGPILSGLNVILWRLVLYHHDLSLDFDLSIQIQLYVDVDVAAAAWALLTFSLELLNAFLAYVAMSTRNDGVVDILHLEADLAFSFGGDVHKHCFDLICRLGR